MERRAVPSKAGLARVAERFQCAIATIAYRYAGEPRGITRASALRDWRHNGRGGTSRCSSI